MSFINEALKKAQKEKDSHYFKYRGVLSFNRDGKANYQRTLFIGLLILFTVSVTIFFMYPRPKIERTLIIPAIETKEEPTVISQRVDEIKTLYEDAVDSYKKKLFAKAKKQYYEILELDPGYVDALNNLGVIYIHERNFSEARVVFEKAARLQSDDPNPYYNLACIYAMNEEREKGLFYLGKAILIDDSVKQWAQKDTDLDNLKNIPEFQTMIK